MMFPFSLIGTLSPHCEVIEPRSEGAMLYAIQDTLCWLFRDSDLSTYLAHLRFLCDSPSVIFEDIVTSVVTWHC